VSTLTIGRLTEVLSEMVVESSTALPCRHVNTGTQSHYVTSNPGQLSLPSLRGR